MRPEKRILVVDDDDAIRALVVTVLRRRGYAVDAARNGVDAMEMIQGHRYALVVLDLMMPRMSGYEVMDALGRMSVMSRPRVLVLTAGHEPRSLDTELVVGTIHKPFDIELLLDIVTGCLTADVDTDLPPPTSEAVLTSRPN
jgi:CheY-like chemotaxis protein